MKENREDGLTLAPYLALSRDLSALITPVSPDDQFRAQLYDSLVDRARRQQSQPMLLPLTEEDPETGIPRRVVRWVAQRAGARSSLGVGRRGRRLSGFSRRAGDIRLAPTRQSGRLIAVSTVQVAGFGSSRPSTINLDCTSSRSASHSPRNPLDAHLRNSAAAESSAPPRRPSSIQANMQSRTIVFCVPTTTWYTCSIHRNHRRSPLTRRVSVRAGIRRTRHVDTWPHNVGVIGQLTRTCIIVLPASH